jgi:hypothetical protein
VQPVASARTNADFSLEESKSILKFIKWKAAGANGSAGALDAAGKIACAGAPLDRSTRDLLRCPATSSRRNSRRAVGRTQATVRRPRDDVPAGCGAGVESSQAAGRICPRAEPLPRASDAWGRRAQSHFGRNRPMPRNGDRLPARDYPDGRLRRKTMLARTSSGARRRAVFRPHVDLLTDGAGCRAELERGSDPCDGSVPAAGHGRDDQTVAKRLLVTRASRRAGPTRTTRRNTEHRSTSTTRRGAGDRWLSGAGRDSTNAHVPRTRFTDRDAGGGARHATGCREAVCAKRRADLMHRGWAKPEVHTTRRPPGLIDAATW